MSSGGQGGAGSCLANWQANPSCAHFCTDETQSDHVTCARVLDCYRDNNCGPSTCTAANEACSPNTLQLNTAPYPFAAAVFSCQRPTM